MTIPVYAKGMHINDNGELVIDADALAEAGVRSVEIIEDEPPSVEEVFKAAMREIKELAQEALGYEQICEPVQAVRRLAQEFAAAKAQLAETRAELRDWIENRGPKLAAEAGNARAERAEAENARLRGALGDFITEYKETHEDCDCGACVLCYGLAALAAESAQEVKE